jgi:Kef-type K+ transport system membrane component KefB
LRNVLFIHIIPLPRLTSLSIALLPSRPIRRTVYVPFEMATSTAASATATASATPQGGVLQHVNPLIYQAGNPVVLFIVQMIIIILFCRLLHYPLSLIRQPRVIAEVIGGILLGPSAFGRIPGFTKTIFPMAGMPSINLVANLGLILFLYVVGLEADVRYLTSNWRLALGVGVGGMAVPFGLGYAIAVGLYHQFPTGIPISFPIFGLFVGVAMAITAFPVLCRILTEMKLLNTRVGVVVLSAGVGNDVAGEFLDIV